jgi:hypothetical protein
MGDVFALTLKDSRGMEVIHQSKNIAYNSNHIN